MADFSKRPLYLEEIAEAAIVKIDGHRLDRFDNARDLVEIYSSIVLIVEDEFDPREQLRLAHPSVQEYLLSGEFAKSGIFPSPFRQLVADKFIAEACLTYLDLAIPPSIDQFPLLRYAAEFCNRHAGAVLREGDPQDDLLDKIFNFLSAEGSLQRWISVYDPDLDGVHMASVTPEASPFPLYYASYLGFTAVVKRLLEQRFGDVNRVCGQCGTALEAAASEGHKSIVELLISKDAEVNKMAGKYGTAL